MLTKKSPITPFFVRVTAVFAIFLILFLIWSPFSMKTTAAVEEWGLYKLFDMHGDIYAYTSAVFTIRPFSIVPFYLGYILTPDSFFGLNLILFLTLLLQGVLLYSAVLFILPKEPVLAFFTAALGMIFPSDTGIFGLRSVQIHICFVLYLSALYLLLRYQEHPNKLFLLGMWLGTGLSVLTYEVIYPLFFVTPLILLWFERRITKKLVYLVALWYIPLIVTLSWAGLRFAQTNQAYAYNAVVSMSASLNLLSNLKSMFQNLVRAYYQNLVGGWVEAFRNLLYPSTVPSVALSVVTLAFAIGRLQSSFSALQVHNAKRYAVLLLSALAVIGIGFSLYLLSPSHRILNDRVFYFASVGAAFATVIALFMLSRRLQLQSYLWVALAGLLTTAAVNASHQLKQLEVYAGMQQSLILGIVKNIPQVEPNTTIVIFDEKAVFRYNFWTFSYSSIVENALNYTYQNYANPVRVVLCYPDGIRSANEVAESCTLGEDGIEWTSNIGSTIIPYEQIIAVEYNERDVTLLDNIPAAFLPSPTAAQGYNPFELISYDGSLPPRIETLFSAHIDVPTSQPEHSATFEFDTFPLGMGWSIPERGQIWMGSTRSSYHTWLLPQDYMVEFRTIWSIKPEIWDSLRLSVNGQPVETTYTQDDQGGRIHRGSIPRRLVSLDPEETVLTFEVDEVVSPASLGMDNDSRTLGVLFDWLRIEPVAP